MSAIVVDSDLAFIFMSIIALSIKMGIILKSKRFYPKKDIIHIGFYVYVIFVISITLFPIRIPLEPNNCNMEPCINLNLFEGINYDGETSMVIYLKNILGNLFLLTPLGIFLSYMWNEKFNSVVKITILGFLVSLTIEAFQYLEVILNLNFGGRVVDITDLVLNTLGIIIGYVVFKKTFNNVKVVN